jgi:hypothetical protein
MELSDLLPDNNINWKINGKFLLFKKYEYIPVCFIGDDNTVYIFLDAKIYKEVVKLTRSLIRKNIEFYFTTPEMSDPRGVEDYKNKVILHYLRSYSKIEFFEAFQKIGFDLIYNMVKWTEKEGCYELVKSNYEGFLKVVNRKEYNWFNGKGMNVAGFEYPEKIRDAFHGLYRDIQISKIL